MPVPVEAVVVAPVTVHPSPLIMDPVAAGVLGSPLMRSLVVVSATPFQITRVDSTDPRFRCDLPTDPPSTIHRLPVVFLGGAKPGKVNAHIRIQTTAAVEPLEAEVSINLTDSESAGAEKTAGEGLTDGKPETSQVDPVFGPAGTAAKPRPSSPREF